MAEAELDAERFVLLYYYLLGPQSTVVVRLEIKWMLEYFLLE